MVDALTKRISLTSHDDYPRFKVYMACLIISVDELTQDAAFPGVHSAHPLCVDIKDKVLTIMYSVIVLYMG